MTQIHQVLSSDKVQHVNDTVVRLEFRTLTTNNSNVLELNKSELDKVIKSLEEAKEAIARLNDSRSSK